MFADDGVTESPLSCGFDRGDAAGDPHDRDVDDDVGDVQDRDDGDPGEAGARDND